jgi:hypothetical protein
MKENAEKYVTKEELKKLKKELDDTESLFGVMMGVTFMFFSLVTVKLKGMIMPIWIGLLLGIIGTLLALFHLFRLYKKVKS